MGSIDKDYYGSIGPNDRHWFIGVVKDTKDPKNSNRVRVRIKGIHPEVGDDVTPISSQQNTSTGSSNSTTTTTTTSPSTSQTTLTASSPSLISIDEKNLPNSGQWSAKISKYFTLGDLCASAQGRKAREKGNLTPSIIKNLSNLATNCLDPIKAHFGGLIITSGWRMSAAQGGVGSSRNHPPGYAADIQVKGVSSEALANWIQQNLRGRFTALEICPHHVHIQLGGDPNGNTTTPHVYHGADA